jgi:photosystem II stability/assembly factor-like uncharacterized protein
MHLSLPKSACLLGLLFVVASSTPLPARQAGAVGPNLIAEMRWRNIGPLRGGRTKAVAGVPSQPFTFYIGMVNGGVWKTTNAGRTWTPIFEDQPTGSIGWVAVAPSDPNIVYVGSGEGLQRPDLSVGDGIYKSTDAGKTWTHLPGLRDGQQIPKIEIDPKNPNRLFVAVLGHPYGPNAERGIFRSTDGGQSFQRVLYRDEDTGGKDVDIDPSNPSTVYATMWEARQGPWENGAWGGDVGGIFKSTDGGDTWKPLTNGLPPCVRQAELAIAQSNPKRIYAYVSAGGGGGGRGGGRGAAGAAAAPGSGPATAPSPCAASAPAGGGPIYRSDDAGETWTPTTSRSGVGSSDEAVPIVDPKNPDWVIVTSQVTYKTEDGGKTWVPFKGAPGGDDYQNAWINPVNPDIILLASDQGAVVSLDKGASWSSWYNQSTAAMYHVMTDNAWPYRVCGGQQDSGSACVASRGVDGAITMREWHPAAIEEYGYAAPDPLDPDVVYGTKEVTRYDRRTGQVSQVGPLGGRGGGGASNAAISRTVRTAPIVFSQVDPHALFFATNVLWKTVDGGINWKQISPDLTRKTHELPKSVGKYTEQALAIPPNGGGPQVDNNGARVIYTIGPSYKDINRIWAGTDDGVIQTTADGGLHWTDVTPKQMGAYWKVFIIDAGRFDPLTAYAALNTLRVDDMNPHIVRTHDGGKTWTEIVNGIPAGAAVSVVREDPIRQGLLFAGSETQVYFSIDDGDHWQSLRLNMAASSVRDLVIKDDDLVVGTHGRGIWILDDITPLRQIDQKTADNDVLFKPETAWRVRWDTNSDTPLPPDEPRLPNPPEGAIINYYLKSAASGPVTLEIFGADNRLVRRYSSADPIPSLPDPVTAAPLPLYWYRQPKGLSAAAGMHRFMWDVHYQPLPGTGGGGGRGGAGGGALPMQAIPFDTAPAPSTPWVNPGIYTVKLTVNGTTYSKPITVKQDPRVKTSTLTMRQVYALTKASYDGAVDARKAEGQAQGLRDQIAKLQATGDVAKALADFDAKVAALAGGAGAGAGGGGRGGAGRGGRGFPAVQVGAAGTAGTPVTGAPPPPTPPPTLADAAGGLSGVMSSLTAADVTPTAIQLKAITTAQATADGVTAKWTAIKTIDLPAINVKLKAAGLAPLTLP